MAGGWLGADYLSAKWVADGYLWKQPFVVAPGAWVNQRYLSRKWVADTWLHYVVSGTGATVAVGNVPGVLLAALDGSARQTTKVNATTTALPLSVFAAAANASRRVTQANVPNLALSVFPATANGSLTQIADVTFTIEVESLIEYSKVVTAQNVPGLALGAIDAIVTLGADVNIPVTRVDLPLGVFPTTAKANTSTRAVSTISLPLGVYDCDVAVGRMVTVTNVLAVPLATNPVSVEVTENTASSVRATVTSLDLGTFAATVVATNNPDFLNSAGSLRISMSAPSVAFRQRKAIAGIRAA